MQPNLFDCTEVFVLVAGDDTYPAWTPNTIHAWSSERGAADFAAAGQTDGVDIASIDCPSGFLELLEDLLGVGCDRVNFDGATFSISEAIEALRHEIVPAPHFPMTAVPLVQPSTEVTS